MILQPWKCLHFPFRPTSRTLTASQDFAPATHWTGGWVVPRAVLDAVVKRIILSHHQESNSRNPIVYPTALIIIKSKLECTT